MRIAGAEASGGTMIDQSFPNQSDLTFSKSSLVALPDLRLPTFVFDSKWGSAPWPREVVPESVTLDQGIQDFFAQSLVYRNFMNQVGCASFPFLP